MKKFFVLMVCGCMMSYAMEKNEKEILLSQEQLNRNNQPIDPERFVPQHITQINAINEGSSQPFNRARERLTDCMYNSGSELFIVSWAVLCLGGCAVIALVLHH